MPVRTRNTNDEISLLREAAAGSAPAFLGLVQTYDRAVLNLALRATGSSEQAHRIYLDVFLNLRRALGSVEPGTVRAWIYRLAVQSCLEHLRRPRVSSTGPAAIKPLERALRTLTPRERMVFELRHYDRLDFAEVGQALETTAEAATSTFARAIGRLRRALAPTSDELQCTES